jgi:fatty acid desaturase
VKMPADSVIYASWNLVAIGAAFAAAWTDIRGWGWQLYVFLLLIGCPILLILTFAHGVGDVFRQPTRHQGVLGLLLMVPACIVEWWFFHSDFLL